MESKRIPRLISHESYPYKLLPEGVYPCSESEFQRHFVDSFSASQTRAQICEGFFRLRDEAKEHEILASQWIDGSFVEDKSNPNDVDVVTFIDYDFLNNQQKEVQEFIQYVLNGRDSTKAKYETHAFMVACCQRDHNYFSIYERWRRYWRNWFGKTRDIEKEGKSIPGIQKGFIQMSLGNDQETPKISAERG